MSLNRSSKTVLDLQRENPILCCREQQVESLRFFSFRFFRSLSRLVSLSCFLGFCPRLWLWLPRALSLTVFLCVPGCLARSLCPSLSTSLVPSRFLSIHLSCLLSSLAFSAPLVRRESRCGLCSTKKSMFDDDCAFPIYG